MWLNKVLLSSYALGESHPDSRWMAFKVWGLPEPLTVILSPSTGSGQAPRRIFGGNGNQEILHRFAPQNDSESFPDEQQIREVKSWENESLLSGLLEFFLSVSLSFRQIRMPKPQMPSGWVQPSRYPANFPPR
jgi:hypothetical protein